MERTCLNCDKVNVCSLYRQAVSFAKAFEAEYADIAKLPFPVEAIAMSCKEYLPPQIFSKYDQFSYEELTSMTQSSDESLRKEATAELFRRKQMEKSEALGV